MPALEMDWACKQCDAQPGEPCIGMPEGKFHAGRTAAALYWHYAGGEAASPEDWNKAVEESGLV